MEPRWDAPPPQPTQLPYLPLERIKPGGAFRAIITTPTALGVWTHFMGGRTLPCMDSDCPGCLAQMPRRWEGYLGCLTPSPSRHIIVALTPAAALGISDTAVDRFALRGNLIIFERAGKRLNSRLRARVEPIEFYQKMLPPEPDLKAHLMHIWGLEQSHQGQDNQTYVNRVQQFYKGNGKPADEKPVP